MTDKTPPTYHMTGEDEIIFIERIARVMRDHAELRYPYGIVTKWDQYRELLLDALPELRILAARNARKDREVMTP
jgi:hypothetical protein